MTETPPMNPTALPRAALAKLLSAVGEAPVPETLLADDEAAGAPINPDGTWNLVHYAAWLAKQLAAGDDAD